LNLISLKSDLIEGNIVCPGDKSISQRILILGWLLNKNITISGFLNAEDPVSTANALNQISDSIQINGNEVIIEERIAEPKNPENPIDLGNSGTGMRLIFGLISGLGIEANLIGDDSLSKRPMRRVANPLKEMGASNKLNIGGTPPIEISKGKIIDDFVYEMPVASAQVKSSIMLAAIAAKKGITVIEKNPTRNHTERMIEYFKGNIEISPIWWDESKSLNSFMGNKITYKHKELICPNHYDVVGDFSSASFLIVAGLISKSGKLIIENVGLNPSRSLLIKILKSMGGNISISNERMVSNEEVADITISPSKLKGFNISDLSSEVPADHVIPNIIDEIPILCIAAAFAEGSTMLRDLEELTVKESNRLAAICDGFDEIGIKYFSDRESSIKLYGNYNEDIDGAEVDSHGDHRIAMSFLVAGMRSKNGIKVRDCKNIETSFPNFTHIMNSLGMKINEKD
tara:strand:- start:75670 stop:77043 length:1374 start_codon:yes stop_codon:yes gene_type:complete